VPVYCLAKRNPADSPGLPPLSPLTSSRGVISLLDALAEAAGPGTKGSLSALKKADLAKAAEEKPAGTGWLPAILRVA